MSHLERVIVLVDMDCFYCQVEENLNPSFKGKPLAVVQYNAWKGGGIIAVNYEARKRGVTRHMRGDEAKQKCPEIELARVPNVRGKADLTKYREAGKSVAKVLQTFTLLLERASVDEAYLDITEMVKQRMSIAQKEISLNDIYNTFIVGSDPMDFLYNLYNSGLHEESILKLAYGGVIAEEIRATVYQETGYTCSAGIAHNKILAKLASGLNKPNKQTILPQSSVAELYKELPVRKIQSLGGKFGHLLSEDLGITNMGELVNFTEKELRRRYDEKTALWLYNIARGINTDPVTTRLVSKSIACCKKFPGKSALTDADSIKHWISELAEEIVERLDKDLKENTRKAKQMVISFSQEVQGKDIASSRTHFLTTYDVNKITADTFELIKKHCLKPSGAYCVKFLGISAGKFEDCRNVNEITAFFKAGDKNDVKHDSNSKEISLTEKNQTEPANTSDTTEELDENSTDLEFFNETEKNKSVSDSDSISNELCNTNTENTTVPEPEKQSFFLRYFENLKNQRPKSPVLRDFDTSRILQEISDDEISNQDVPAPSTSTSTYNTEDIVEICTECLKHIPKFEMQSHMDYHFALKIVREESHVYKNNTPAAIPIQTEKQRKSGKRKLKDVEKNATIKTFLKADVSENTAQDVEECPQCNKKIERANFANHIDYHVAKKLHMEINPVKSCNVKNIESKSTKKNKTENRVTEGVRSVTAFFKPVI